MKALRLIPAGILVLALGVGVTDAGATETQTICHNGVTTEVPHSLMWVHFDESGPPQPGHEGDTRGACPTTPTPPTTVPPVVPCEEDEPCWDCETMGNKVCGPAVIIPPIVVAPPATPTPGQPTTAG